MNAKKASDDRITASDFILGLCQALIIKGRKSFNPNMRTSDGLDLAFHLSCWQAYEFLVQDFGKDRLEFIILLSSLHGDSQTITYEISFMMSLRMIYSRMPGDGTLFFDTDLDPEDFLKRNPIGRDYLMELADCFLREYNLPRNQRSWPEGLEIPPPSLMMALTRK